SSRSACLRYLPAFPTRRSSDLWDGDETWDTSWSTTKTAEHSFASAGDHPVVVQAMDSGGLTANISHVVSVTAPPPPPPANSPPTDRKSTRLNSSHQIISYAVFC